jgi:hypothetical protein
MHAVADVTAAFASNGAAWVKGPLANCGQKRGGVCTTTGSSQWLPHDPASESSAGFASGTIEGINELVFVSVMVKP